MQFTIGTKNLRKGESSPDILRGGGSGDQIQGLPEFMTSQTCVYAHL